MNKNRASILIFLVAFFAMNLSTGFAKSLPDAAPGELLVKFKENVSQKDVEKTNKGIGSKIAKKYRKAGLYHIKLPAGLTVDEAIGKYKGSAHVEYAEPNYRLSIDAVPNDPRFSDLWGLNNLGKGGGTQDADIDAPEAWDITTGSNVVVAVIDSGADWTHEDLRDNIWVNPVEDINGNGYFDASDINGIDDDGNGYVDDIIGWDFLNNDNDPFDDNGHGSHVSGTIAASANNHKGVAGVNWNARIMVLKFLGSTGSGYTSDAISAIEYYTAMGVRISNNSWSGTNYSQAMANAIKSSRSLFVVASGNSGKNTDIFDSYPANYNLDNIISVAATDDDDKLASFSNYGLVTVDLAAPGVSILSSTPGNNYSYYSGTSMATPHVAGVASLLLSQDSSLTVNEMKWRILNGTDNKALKVLTKGRLNANNSLTFGLSKPDASTAVIPTGPTTVARGDFANYKVSATNNTGATEQVTVNIYVQVPNGNITKLNGPYILNIPAYGTVSGSFSKKVSPTLATGSYIIFSRAETANSFDEDPVEFIVTP